MKRKQPIKLKVRRNPRTGSYVAVRDSTDTIFKSFFVYTVVIEGLNTAGFQNTVNKVEFSAWPSVPWEEVPLRVRAQFRKMLREDNERRE